MAGVGLPNRSLSRGLWPHDEYAELAGALYAEHYESICRYISRNIDDSETCRDLAQDVFVDLLRALPRLDTSRPVLAWLRFVARRRVLDEISHRDRETAVLRALALTSRESTEAPSPGSVVEATSGLSPCQRRVVFLRIVVERPFAAIACELGLSEGACRMQYLRALAKLRDAERLGRRSSRHAPDEDESMAVGAAVHARLEPETGPAKVVRAAQEVAVHGRRVGSRAGENPDVRDPHSLSRSNPRTEVRQERRPPSRFGA